MRTRANTKPGKRVLIVDDSEEIREFLELAVEMIGHHAVLAPDMQQGLEVLRAGPVDAVITDVMMQGYAAGLELVTHVRSDLSPPVPPVIVCSGFPHFEEEARRRGAWTFLSKPFTIDHFQDALRGALAGKPAAAELVKRAASRARKLRTRAAEVAEASFREMRDGNPMLSDRAAWASTWAPAYLGSSHAVLLAQSEGGLRVTATNDAELLPVGTEVDDRLPFCRDVLETSSSVLLPDVSAFASSPAGTRPLPLRSFAAVPLRSTTGVAFGAICVFDGRPARLDTDDLAILEVMGQRAAAVVRGEPVARFFETPHVLSKESFSDLLAIELRRARRCSGFVELATVLLGRKQRDGSWIEAVSRITAARRRAVAVLDTDQIGLFAAAHDSETAGRELAAALADVHALLGIRGAGVVAVAGGLVPVVSENALMNVAAILAARTQKGGIERVVFQAEPWPQRIAASLTTAPG
jgi:CheY-like chemotaxis protein